MHLLIYLSMGRHEKIKYTVSLASASNQYTHLYSVTWSLADKNCDRCLFSKIQKKKEKKNQIDWNLVFDACKQSICFDSEFALLLPSVTFLERIFFFFCGQFAGCSMCMQSLLLNVIKKMFIVGQSVDLWSVVMIHTHCVLNKCADTPFRISQT